MMCLYLMNDIKALVMRSYYCMNCRKYYFTCDICGIEDLGPYTPGISSHSHINSKHGGMSEDLVSFGDSAVPPYIMYLVFDATNKSRDECLGGDMSENNYSCVFCRTMYDCFPSKEIVVSHVLACIPRLKTQNQSNNIAYIKGDI